MTNLVPNSSTQSTSSILIKLFLWSAWLIYVGYLLLSDLPPGPSLLHTTPETLNEAIGLSLNFWFVLPTLFPTLAPVLNPALEGLFNLVVAWGLLFFGFYLDRRHQRLPMLPFLIGTALLTNVFYLPWLALRSPNPQPPSDSLTVLETVAESRWFPGIFGGVLVGAIAWGCFGRPEFGDIAMRWTTLMVLVQRDRLAYSFVVDLLVFWVFQSWLVKDDMVRRQWEHPKILWMTRLIPFVGLLIYFLTRPPLKEMHHRNHHPSYN